ncbi:MAG: FecR domain-containing protein [Spirochaetia bacterium]|nr:FecR domain-containing protein [Spirochaetia bacterium]
MKQKVILFLITITLTITSAVCSEKSRAEESDVFMIIYSSKTSTVIRDGKKMKAFPGFILKKNDTIQTKNGTVDIQNRSGSIIRIRDSSSLTINTLLKAPANKAEVTLNEGAMLAKIKKISSDDEYTVHTPTAIAGVRGTTFSVELLDEDAPRVRVYEGTVSVKPNLEILNDKSEEEIRKDKNLSDLKEIQDQQEVILESETETSVTKEQNALIQKVNHDPNPDKIKKLKQMEKITSSESPVNSKEKSELATLSGVEQEMLSETIDTHQNKLVSAETSEQIKTNYNKNLSESMQNMAEETNLQTEEAIKDHYKLYEELVKKTGEKKTGAIVTQVGDDVIFHSADGVAQISTEEIDYVDYFSK